MRVKRFTYNGLFGQLGEGYADYTAEFKAWTSDPGVARCECSDGLERLIPTFALEDFNVADHPKQDYPEGKSFFGVPCES